MCTQASPTRSLCQKASTVFPRTASKSQRDEAFGTLPSMVSHLSWSDAGHIPHCQVADQKLMKSPRFPVQSGSYMLFSSVSSWSEAFHIQSLQPRRGKAQTVTLLSVPPYQGQKQQVCRQRMNMGLTQRPLSMRLPLQHPACFEAKHAQETPSADKQNVPSALVWSL